MGRASKILTPALFAIGAVAQSGSSILGSSTVVTNPSDTGVVYQTYSICPSTESTTITMPTSTFCPGPYCNGGPTGAPSSTVWVTEIIDYCPTATDEAGWLTTMTTTITEACPCMETHAPGYIPSGFTNAAVTCTVCGESSPVATIITPITSGPGAYAYATAAAEATAGAQSGSGSGSGSKFGASTAAAAGAGSGSGSSVPGSGSGSGANSNTQAPAAAAAGANAGANAGTPGSNNAAQYAPAGGAGSNTTFIPPILPSTGSGFGSGTGSSASGISPPIAIQSHAAAPRVSNIDRLGASLFGMAGLVAGLAWQL